jgi:hypothetical protein
MNKSIPKYICSLLGPTPLSLGLSYLANRYMQHADYNVILNTFITATANLAVYTAANVGIYRVLNNKKYSSFENFVGDAYNLMISSVKAEGVGTIAKLIAHTIVMHQGGKDVGFFEVYLPIGTATAVWKWYLDNKKGLVKNNISTQQTVTIKATDVETQAF